MTRLYKASLVCALVPLILGISIFILWYPTRWSWLEFLGIITIYIGVGLFAVGSICLFIDLKRFRKKENVSIKSLTKRGWFPAAILLVNFPMAAFIFLLAINISSAYKVAFVNQSEKSIDKIILQAPGKQFDLGSLEPNFEIAHCFHVKGDGQLSFVAKQGNEEFDGIIEGYVTGSMGAIQLVKMKSNKEFEVTTFKSPLDKFLYKDK